MIILNIGYVLWYFAMHYEQWTHKAPSRYIKGLEQCVKTILPTLGFWYQVFIMTKSQCSVLCHIWIHHFIHYLFFLCTIMSLDQGSAIKKSLYLLIKRLSVIYLKITFILCIENGTGWCDEYSCGSSSYLVPLYFIVKKTVIHIYKNQICLMPRECNRLVWWVQWWEQ